MTENEQSLLPKININVTLDDDKNSNLHLAAARGNNDQVSIEIESGCKIDAENYLGWTPLMMATKNGHFDAVKTLVEKRADATRKNKFGASVFIMAVANGKLDTVHFLLQHLLCGGVSKQSIEAVISPISVSILFGHDHIVQYLLEKSFNVNSAIISTGLTPLMFAAVKENTTIYNLLTTKGANLHAKNVNNQTSQDIIYSRQTMTYSPQFFPVHKQACMQHMRPPVYYLSPHPTFLNVSPNYEMERKSSDLLSPNYFFNPNLTPISPINFVPQIFFPPDFSPNQMVRPVNSYYYSNEMLNVRLNQSGFYSPVTQNINYQSPGTSVHYQPWLGNTGNKTPVL